MAAAISIGPVAGASAGMAAGMAAAGMAWAVRGRASSVFGPSVWHGPRDQPVLALTFDDGPSEGTPAILDILHRHGVRATFFQCGANVDRLPGIAQEVHAAGHLIGNHSYSHSMFCFRSRAFMENDLTRAQETIAARTGQRPEWFRAPFGVRWFGMSAAARRLGLSGVMWTRIGYDWKLRPEAILKRMSVGVPNGAILCLHDGRELQAHPDVGATVEAVHRLVPMLLGQGFKLETVSRLICPKN